MTMAITNMSKEDALKKVAEMFPDKYVSVKLEEDLSRHPGSTAELDTRCGIYVSGHGYWWGTTFEECLAQL